LAARVSRKSAYKHTHMTHDPFNHTCMCAPQTNERTTSRTAPPPLYTHTITIAITILHLNPPTHIHPHTKPNNNKRTHAPQRANVLPKRNLPDRVQRVAQKEGGKVDDGAVTGVGAAAGDGQGLLAPGWCWWVGGYVCWWWVVSCWWLWCVVPYTVDGACHIHNT
jgi:hypothetical protein